MRDRALRPIQLADSVLPHSMPFPTQCPIFTHFIPNIQNHTEAPKIAQMEPTIAHLIRQKAFNYTKEAKLLGIDRRTLVHRHKGQTVSRAEATLTFHQRLNNTQEDTLLGYINALTDRHILSTTQIIRNLAEEIVNESIKKN